MKLASIVHECACEACHTGLDQAVAASHQRINLLMSRLNEPQRRWYAATLSEEQHAPSDRILALITGLDEKTIRRGRAELQEELVHVPIGRQRRAGGGRMRAEKRPAARAQVNGIGRTAYRWRPDEQSQVVELPPERCAGTFGQTAREQTCN